MKEKRYIIVYLDSYMCFGYGDCKVIGITDDISLWSRMEFFEINEIQADGTVVKIKDCKDGDLFLYRENDGTRYVYTEKGEYYCDMTDEMKLLIGQTELN